MTGSHDEKRREMGRPFSKKGGAAPGDEVVGGGGARTGGGGGGDASGLFLKKDAFKVR